MTKEQIEKLIEEGKNYLENDDLDGFYGWLDNKTQKYQENGQVTNYFLDQGNMTSEELMSYFKEMIPIGCFSGTDIKSAIIPSNIKEIDWFAFGLCKSLKSVKLPDTLKEIYDEAFYKCENLTDINVPQNLIYVADSAFDDCPEETQEKFRKFMK